MTTEEVLDSSVLWAHASACSHLYGANYLAVFLLLLLTCSFETSWTFRARITSTRVVTWSKEKYCQVILFKKNFIFQFDLQLRDLLNVSGLGWLNKGGDMVKAKRPPGNSFQKNFIFQFDCAASSPLCYAIPKKRQSSLQTHRGKWRGSGCRQCSKMAAVWPEHSVKTKRMSIPMCNLQI